MYFYCGRDLISSSDLEFNTSPHIYNYVCVGRDFCSLTVAGHNLPHVRSLGPDPLERDMCTTALGKMHKPCRGPESIGSLASLPLSVSIFVPALDLFHTVLCLLDIQRTLYCPIKLAAPFIWPELPDPQSESLFWIMKQPDVCGGGFCLCHLHCGVKLPIHCHSDNSEHAIHNASLWMYFAQVHSMHQWGVPCFTTF